MSVKSAARANFMANSYQGALRTARHYLGLDLRSISRVEKGILSVTIGRATTSLRKRPILFYRRQIAGLGILCAYANFRQVAHMSMIGISRAARVTKHKSLRARRSAWLAALVVLG